MAPRKPPTAAHYTPKDVALVRSACLTLATYLGSFVDDVVVVVAWFRLSSARGR